MAEAFLVAIGVAISALFAYERTRWVGQKYHRAVFSYHLIFNISCLSLPMMLLWHPSFVCRLVGFCVMTALSIFAGIRYRGIERELKQSENKR